MSGPLYHWTFPSAPARAEVFAAELAADIVATATQYPAVRQARCFGDLHAVYDANESVLAAAEAVGVDLGGQEGLDAANEASVIVDEALQAGGWEAMCELVATGWEEDLRADLTADLAEGGPFAAFEDDAVATLQAALDAGTFL